MEAVSMIVHILTVEQKGGILRACHKIIPRIGIRRLIGGYSEHLT